ncbi:hypothetical protein [Altibacter lentus]|uniref:hypothetical protein n=1 Tax=Altibacter lentus TaxID=1223410 RepID=UPI00054D15AF|nr:hypothetical protein [Altibacter lentus]
MKKNIIFRLFCCLLIVACSKDGGNDDPSETLQYVFSGTMSTPDISNPIEGIITVEASGTFKLESVSGNITGNTQKEGTEYTISVTSSNGLFEGTTNFSGSLSSSSENFSLSGTYKDGKPLTAGGSIIPVVETTPDGGFSALDKSTVLFSHNESCIASITINATTLSPLNGHYYEGALCAPFYSQYLSIPANVENETSTLFCNTIRILDLNGEYITIEDCSTAKFILNKNTSYTYTVTWQNGEVTNGEFTSLDGGQNLAICLETNGPDCSGQGGNTGEGTYTFEPLGTYTGQTSCDNEGTLTISNIGITLSVYWTNVSGDINFTPEYFQTNNCNDCPLIIIYDGNNDKTYVSESGSGTWSGTDFSFDASMRLTEGTELVGPSYNLNGSLNCE